MKNARIFEGNCLDVMREMEDCSVDLAITSPPYDNLRTYDGKSEWGDHVWKKAIMGLYRVLKDGGVCVWIVSDQSINGSETGSSFRQALHAMDCGFRLHDTMIWEKPGFTATGALRVRYAQVFEYMFIFSKGRPKTFNPIKDRKNKSAGGKQHGSNRLPDGTFKQKSSDGRIT
ncbi:MAG: site-specific DNA-methyltransferase, partial [Proteobacteria bacterium]|nr:site-specific DNA-methyltransferase [Pseudomonadota bacterium]